ncbi:MAG: sialidase [Acidobacteria bacterium]|nr:sialidase [Acidobacteriota bacterium]
MNIKGNWFLLGCLLAGLAVSGLGQVKVDSQTISGLGIRNIGSAAMSGRIAALDARRDGDRLTIYVGAASGGVWKSINGGNTYKPVFDKQDVQSIGAVTIDPKNPKTVWVGTGESWTRNSVSVGDGIYKTTDGGDNWTNMGLKDSERIAKILVDPKNPDTVYACATGKLWSDSTERGVYKTTNGGRSWVKVLAGSNQSTGCGMMAMDQNDPRVLYAAMWDFRRQGWTFRSGGADENAPSGSGLFRSNDGGATWKEIDENSGKGLPPKPWGRTAVAVAPSNPKVIYITVEAAMPRNGLYRSDDEGKTWTALDRSQMMIWRPFYFSNLIVDPHDENKLFKAGGSLIYSSDGGRSFSNVAGSAHGDFHDVWIDPTNSNNVITGDDGGLWFSYDGAAKWWKADNLPVSQFYHVTVDMNRPYNVYGGLQDNSSWVGPSSFPGGITNHQWENLYGGDGFWTWADPTDPDYVYAESQGGYIGRINRKTHEARGIQPLPGYKEGKLRFNWNTPIHVTKAGTVYIGSQFLFRTRDHGQTWDRISPDLTTNDPSKQKQEESGGIIVDNSSAEEHTTIFSICESPLDPNTVWVGTDDGNVQVTRDGGKSWTNVVANIPGLPKNAWVTSVDAGHFSAGTAYATFDLHTFGDLRPYAYKTTDFGKTWTAVISPASNVRGYAHVIKEDLVNKDLLFAGTEFGLWVSLDGGNVWSQYKGGEFPDGVAVRDLAIHPRDKDLVIATHGRGIWIIDDISPLRALTPDTLQKDIAFLQADPVVQKIQAGGGWNDGDSMFVGENAPDDAVITYYQKKRHIFGDLKIDILDAKGSVVGSVPASKRKGLNRVHWAMRLPAPTVPPAASIAGGATTGPRVMPGTYTVRMTKDKQVYTTPLKVTLDPRVKFNLADRQANFDLSMKLYNLLGQMSADVERINSVRLALDDRAAKTSDTNFRSRLKAASAQVDELRRKIVATKEGGAITGEERLREFLATLYGDVISYEGRPSLIQMQRADSIAKELADVRKAFDAWTATELPKLNSDLTQYKMQPITVSEVVPASNGGGVNASGIEFPISMGRW